MTMAGEKHNLLHFVVTALREHPELALFLTVAIGFLIGKMKYRGFSLGVVVGCLLAGVIIGQLNIPIPAIVKSVFFSLFLFTTGYKVGPQFFRGLKGDAIPQLAMTLVLCLSCLIIAFIVSKLMGYDVGTAAGLLAGAFTESTVIGTAGEAIQRLPLAESERNALVNNIPVAYAVTYLIGTAFLVWFIPNVGPRLMRINLREEAARMREAESTENETVDSSVLSAARSFDVRAYRVSNPEIANKTVAQIESLPKNVRVFILRVRSGDRLVQATNDLVIREGDVLAVIGPYAAHATRGRVVGPEVSDPALLDMPIESLEVVVTSQAADGKSLAALAQLDFARGVFLSRLTRSGVELPISATTQIDRGDVMRLIGTLPEVERAAKALGYPDRKTSETDMVFVGLGIFLGGLIGLLSWVVAGVPLTLTASGGALVMGLVFGWLRSAYRYFGRIPEPAIWIFDTVGLCIFIAIVGLNAGPSFISGLKTTGFSLVLAGLIVAVLPHILAILFGRYVLRMNPLIVLGAATGAGTITAALRAVQQEADSNIPALGYTIPYALGNIILTAWGPVLVAMMSF
jgi:putative transport protein